MAWRFSSSNNPAPDADIPAGDNIDQDAWRLAEETVRSKNGGFGGISKEQKHKQIKEAYDQIAGHNAQARKWEGTEDTGM